MPLSDKEYVATGGQQCPLCGERDVEASGPIEADWNNAWQSVKCNACDNDWTDVYRLVGYDMG